MKADDDWSDYRLESDPRFLKRVAEARRSLSNGEGIDLEDVDEARSLRGTGWEGDLDEMRSGRSQCGRDESA